MNCNGKKKPDKKYNVGGMVTPVTSTALKIPKKPHMIPDGTMMKDGYVKGGMVKRPASSMKKKVKK